jgi:protein TonB
MGSASGVDNLDARIRVAVVASVLINLVVWNAAASIARRPVIHAPQMVEITRVNIDRSGHKTVRVVTPKMIRHKIQQVHKEIIKPRPVVVRSQPQPRPHQPAPPPPGAHNRVLIAKADPHAPPPAPDDHTALAGGNADVGKPTDQQAVGDAKVNPPTPPAKVPETQPAPTPPAKTPETQPMPTQLAPAATQPAVPPPTPPKPKPTGPTRDAQPANQVQPEIPDSLKSGDYKSFVRVRVEISADGSFTPILRTSSGNPEIDKRVLEALKRWKWQPALQNGEPVDSVQLFKFEFEVN